MVVPASKVTASAARRRVTMNSVPSAMTRLAAASTLRPLRNSTASSGGERAKPMASQVASAVSDVEFAQEREQRGGRPGLGEHGEQLPGERVGEGQDVDEIGHPDPERVGEIVGAGRVGGHALVVGLIAR